MQLSEYAPVVFSNEFRREETEQRYDSNGECQPIETCIEWNTEHCTCKRKDCTHNSFIEQVREEQDEEQTTYSAEKECFTPDRHTPIEQLCFLSLPVLIMCKKIS